MDEKMKYGKGEHGTYVLRSKQVYDHGNPDDMIMKFIFEVPEVPDGMSSAIVTVPFAVGTKCFYHTSSDLDVINVVALGTLSGAPDPTDTTPVIEISTPGILYGKWIQL